VAIRRFIGQRILPGASKFGKEERFFMQVHFELPLL
jgi:hypothetical protein